MKHTLLALVLFVVSLTAFAEELRPRPRPQGPVVIRPRPLPPVVIRPRPRPAPRPTYRPCQVVMVDRMNRVFRRYRGYTDYNGMCRDSLRQCNYDVQRMGMWGYRCATVQW